MFYQNDLQRLMSSPEEVCRNMAFSLALRCIQNIPRSESIDCIMCIKSKWCYKNILSLLSLLTLAWQLNSCQPSCTVWAAETLMWSRQPWGTCRNMCCSVKVFCLVGLLLWVDVLLIVLHWRNCGGWIFRCKLYFVGSRLHSLSDLHKRHLNDVWIT